MKKFLKEYTNPSEERFNFGLINRDHDRSIIEYIVNSCKSLEVMPEIEFLGYDVITDEKRIDMNDYINVRNKTKSDIKYMYMHDSRYIEMRIKFRITTKTDMKLVNKKLLVPIADEDGYYFIKGKKYFLIYQLVDASTYTNRDTVPLKSLMPISVKRNTSIYSDTDGIEYKAPTYTVYIFRKEVQILQLYFAKLGVSKALKYFNVDKVIHFVDKERDKENNVYFSISNKMFLEVNRKLFDKYQYLQSITFMILILEGVSNRLTPDMLEDKVFWMERLGSLTGTQAYNYLERGNNMLTFFSRMLDETTKEVLKLDDDNRRSVYATVRWMVQNYNELRKKDNMDLSNKRIRCNEYVASLLTQAFSERMNRAITKGSKVSVKTIGDIFKFPGSILMDKLYSSGLLRFDDRINDMDFFSKLLFTQKGPNAMGGKNDRNIITKYRDIHPSYIGHIDLNVCSSSDPGSGGVFTPFCETDGLYFSSAREPEGGIFDFTKDVIEVERERNPNKQIVDLYSEAEDIQEWFDRKNANRDITQKFGISRKQRNPGRIVIRFSTETEDDI